MFSTSVENLWESCVVRRQECAGLDDAWERIKNWFASRVSDNAYQTWLSRTTLGSFHDGELSVRVPDGATEAWIRQEYGSEIRTAADELGIRLKAVRYELDSVPTGATAARPAP